MAFIARAPVLWAAFFAIAPLLCTLAEEKKIDIGPLYIHQVWLGTGINQFKVVQPSTDIGSTVVNNWSILDEPPADPSAKVVGFARGFHMLASPSSEFSWFTVMNLVFQDQSPYNGSTLAVIGTTPFSSEWSIVGGTGVFSIARGSVRCTVDSSQRQNGKMVYKVVAHVIYGEPRDTTTKGSLTAVVDN